MNPHFCKLASALARRNVQTEIAIPDFRVPIRMVGPTRPLLLHKAPLLRPIISIQRIRGVFADRCGTFFPSPHTPSSFLKVPSGNVNSTIPSKPCGKPSHSNGASEREHAIRRTPGAPDAIGLLHQSTTFAHVGEQGILGGAVHFPEGP